MKLNVRELINEIVYIDFINSKTGRRHRWRRLLGFYFTKIFNTKIYIVFELNLHICFFCLANQYTLKFTCINIHSIRADTHTEPIAPFHLTIYRFTVYNYKNRVMNWTLIKSVCEFLIIISRRCIHLSTVCSLEAAKPHTYTYTI